MASTIEKIMRILCIATLFLSSYLLYLHYTPEQLNSSFCNLNSYLSCATVNTSTYATFLGIPVALIGLIGFLFLTYLLFSSKSHAPVFFTFSLAFAFLFMVYLTVAELFFIKAVCILCITVALITLILFLLALKIYGKETVQYIKEIQFE